MGCFHTAFSSFACTGFFPRGSWRTTENGKFKAKQNKKPADVKVLATKVQKNSEICEEVARSDFDKSQFTKFDTR